MKATRWLVFAASPSFALAALTSAAHSGDAAAMTGSSVPGGMTLMYAMMAVFHAAPWLRFAGRRLRAGRKGQRSLRPTS